MIDSHKGQELWMHFSNYCSVLLVSPLVQLLKWR